MKIQIASDIHTEFGSIPHISNDGADLLVLAGDIVLANSFKNKERTPRNVDYYMFFDRVCDQFKNVIYIMGNHEHYKSTLSKTAGVLREALSYHKNLHLLDSEHIDIDGIRFIGSTLWTKIDVHNPLLDTKIRHAMNDYSLIKYIDKGNYRKLRPEDTHREHVISRIYLEGALYKAEEWDNIPCVVVTHHAPSWKSIHEKYANENDLNTLYATDLEYLMNDNVKLWIHGHTHTAFDYNINGTRIVCNPYGYPHERSAELPAKIVEV